MHCRSHTFTYATLTLLLSFLASPAPAAIEVPGNAVRFTWTPSSGPVIGYLVYVSFDDQPEYLLMATPEPETTILSVTGRTVAIRVVPFDETATTGPSSPISDAVTFVDPTPPGGDPGDPPPDPGDPPGNEDPPPDPGEDPPPDPDPPGNEEPPPPLEPVLRLDLDDDGRTDYPFRNPDTGEFAVSSGNGDKLGASILQETVPLAFSLVGTPDLDGDGAADLLWQDLETGAIEAMLSTLGWVGLQAVEGPGPARVVGTGDYTGDGRSEIVVTDHAAEELVLWIMDGAARVESVRLGTWRGSREVLASADVDGDLVVELVSWNYSAAIITVWNLDGGEVGAKPGYDAQDIGSDWIAVGAGDVDGDGPEEVVWLDPGSGDLELWRILADNSTRVDSVSMPQFRDPLPVLVGDLDGDGRSEVLTEDNRGKLRITWLDGDTVLGRDTVLTLTEPWTIEAVTGQNPQLW